MSRPLVWATVTALSLYGAASVSNFMARSVAPAAPSGPGSAMAARMDAGPPVLTVHADLRGHFTVHPSLNGRTVRMLVDTGASLVVLSHEDARMAGLSPASRGPTRRFGTANGEVQAAVMVVPEIRLGSIRVTNVEVAVMPAGALDTSLLGMSFIKRLKSFDIGAGRLTLRG